MQDPNVKIALPPVVSRLLGALRRAGFSAYVVGGCVRDSLLGRTPGDWDICTSARPEQIRRVFAGYRQILTGEKHGTIAVIVGGVPYEITTYRVDGAYHDGRHPDSVRFVPDVRQDLARRDFTVNAMAYAPGEGLVDAFGGRADLRAGIIRCVGNPRERFEEDALRVLRAVRFAAQLDFALDCATGEAAVAARDTVMQVSAERVFTELDKLLAGPAVGRVLSAHGGILSGAIPEIAPCMGCTQPGRWHCYDVWQHTAAAVGALNTAGQEEKSARLLRWAVFLHDLAKPECRTLGPDGAAHFPGHNQRGSRMARTILGRLKAPGYVMEGAAGLIAVHDCALPEERLGTLQMMSRCGVVFLQRLCRVKLADLAAHAHNAAVEARVRDVRAFESRVLELSATACYSLNMLAVNGSDLIENGMAPGPAVGRTLNSLLQAVMEERLPNEKSALLAYVQSLQKEHQP